MNKNELVVCGMTAVQTRFQRDPGSMLRLFFDEPTSKKIGNLCKALAAARKVYRCVEPNELELISGTVHHGGIVAVVTAPVLRAPLPADLTRWAEARTPVLLLDRIGNAHNLGAIARTAAFFGVEHIVLPFSPVAALPGEAAYRVAEGGLDFVTVWRVGQLGRFIKDLIAVGYDVIGAASRGGRADAAAQTERPMAVVLGNEEHGLAAEVAAECTRLVTLTGSGRIESLNVSVAGSILLWECFGKRPPSPAAAAMASPRAPAR